MNPSANALILFSHGSLLCGAGEALDAHAERLRRTGTWDQSRSATSTTPSRPSPRPWRSAPPWARPAFWSCLFFWSPATLSPKALPEQLELARAAYPAIEFTVADAIGFDGGLADALIASAEAPLGPGEWRDDLTAAARGCRARPDCPLYGTPNCPRVPAPDTPARPFVE